MDKIEFSKRTIPFFCVSAYFIKLLFFPATFSDAAVLLIMGSLVAFLEWKLDKNEILKQLAHLKSLEQKIEELGKKVDTVKLASSFSNINGVRKQ